MKTDTHFLFYSKEIHDGIILLDSDEVSHLSQVLRFGEGDQIQITDGNGTVYKSQIEKMKRDKALCSILSTETKKPQIPQIDLFIGMPDKEKLDQICEMAPPLALRSITPLITEQCKKRWWDSKWDKLAVRFNRKVISSMKQSLNPFLTTINSPIELKEILPKIEGQKIVGDENGSTFDKITLDSEVVSLFIGPPAGFSDTEKELFKENNSERLALAPYRLRSEVAVVTALSLFNQKYL